MIKCSGIVIFGSTDVTLAVLESIVAAEIPILGVMSSGSEFLISYSPTTVRNFRAADVAGWCVKRAVPHISYDGFRPLLRLLADKQPVLGLAAGWYHMIPAEVRDRFALGCLGFHASLLPRLRGGAPLNWAILNGDTECGVSLFKMTEGVDDGAIYAQRRTPIGPRTEVGELVAWSRQTCAQITAQELPSIIEGTAKAVPQSGAPTYGLQRCPEDGRILWEQSALEIDRLVRAVSSPYPGAFTHLDKEKIIIWKSGVLKTPIVYGKPGQIVWLSESKTLGVVTGSGLLSIGSATDSNGRDMVAALTKASQRRFEALIT